MPHLLLFSFSRFEHQHHSLLVTLLIGAVAGFLAQVIIPGRGFGYVLTLGVGIAGGWLGDKYLKKYQSLTDSPIGNQIICATAGAMVLCIIVGLVLGKDKKDRTGYKVN